MVEHALIKKLSNFSTYANKDHLKFYDLVDLLIETEATKADANFGLVHASLVGNLAAKWLRQLYSRLQPLVARAALENGAELRHFLLIVHLLAAN